MIVGQPELEIRPKDEEFVKPIGSRLVLTCEVVNIGAQVVDNIRLHWYGPNGQEIVDPAAQGR